jgi:hypothetical protein
MLHRVLADMADRSDRLHVVRYEDLCADPVGEFERLFTCLGVELNDAARTEIVRGTEGNSKNQSHAWRVSRRGGLSRTAFRPMDSKSMIWAWKERISPSEAARIRVITGTVADRFYTDADW